tara:strand:+ start:2368 stop:3339 length:972 start_codon:yes stop_codon:yes gene_type:complete
MKRTLLTILSVLFCAITFAQSVPQGINYQAVARDVNGAVLMNQNLTIQFSVISDITTSAVSWQETHTVTTNDYGLYTAIIGGGAATSVGSSASFDVIDWGASNHLLKVEVDYGGGLIDMGTTAFMSVPYSMNAKTAETAIRKNGEALVQTFYVTFDTSQDFKVNQKPLFDDGIVRFGWDAPGNDIEFYLIPGSEPSGINPANGQPWGNIQPWDILVQGSGFPTDQLQANVWNNDSFLPSISTFISPGVVYDLMPTGLFTVERGSGTISPNYDQANPYMTPNFLGFNNTNHYVGKRPPFPIYNFTYHNLGSSHNTTLQITKISN